MKSQIRELIVRIAQIGKTNTSQPDLGSIQPFKHFILSNGSLDYTNLDERDGSCTRRELLARFLVLNAVIDQGPDIIGVRKLLVDVTNELYLNEVRFLHKPALFFDELGIAVDQILSIHESIKKFRSQAWAMENLSRPAKYNLFMDNSKQVLNYAVFRWGVPLALPLLLENDARSEESKPTALIDYLESWNSAEQMSQQLKDNERYGLGKAIGDKACHLFAKWFVSSFKLTRKTDNSWGPFSYEVPYDSNAGRVLWRTGYFLHWTSRDDYIKKEVVQPEGGKGGKDYLRVTNIRGMKASVDLPFELIATYADIATKHLKSHKLPPKKVEIQRIQHAYLISVYNQTGLDVADFDEGLIFLGTRYCFNHAKPLCIECPLNELCEGYTSSPHLIEDYRT